MSVQDVFGCESLDATSRLNLLAGRCHLAECLAQISQLSPLLNMDVDLEIHAPGLDLHHARWNYHVLFMDEVHAELNRIAERAREGYRNKGRGTVFVNKDAWMTVIRGEWDRKKLTFPCEFIAVQADAMDKRFAPLQKGFEQLVQEYDPARQFVLTVEQHSAGMLSTYLIHFDPEDRS